MEVNDASFQRVLVMRHNLTRTVFATLTLLTSAQIYLNTCITHIVVKSDAVLKTSLKMCVAPLFIRD